MPLVENLIGEQDDMAADEACANCYFYKAAKSRKHGFCQQQPPQFTHIDPDSGFPRFFHPVVSPHAWCGQWEGVEEDAGS
jgi:hypothetical protein